MSKRRRPATLRVGDLIEKVQTGEHLPADMLDNQLQVFLAWFELVEDTLDGDAREFLIQHLKRIGLPRRSGVPRKDQAAAVMAWQSLRAEYYRLRHEEGMSKEAALEHLAHRIPNHERWSQLFRGRPSAKTVASRLQRRQFR